MVGFDDSPVAVTVRPALTTVRQPIQAMGREMARLLMRQITDPGGRPEPRHLPDGARRPRLERPARGRIDRPAGSPDHVVIPEAPLAGAPPRWRRQVTAPRRIAGPRSHPRGRLAPGDRRPPRRTPGAPASRHEVLVDDGPWGGVPLGGLGLAGASGGRRAATSPAGTSTSGRTASRRSRRASSPSSWPGAAGPSAHVLSTDPTGDADRVELGSSGRGGHVPRPVPERLVRLRLGRAPRPPDPAPVLAGHSRQLPREQLPGRTVRVGGREPRPGSQSPSGSCSRGRTWSAGGPAGTGWADTSTGRSTATGMTGVVLAGPADAADEPWAGSFAIACGERARPAAQRPQPLRGRRRGRRLGGLRGRRSPRRRRRSVTEPTRRGDRRGARRHRSSWPRERPGASRSRSPGTSRSRSSGRDAAGTGATRASSAPAATAAWEIAAEGLARRAGVAGRDRGVAGPDPRRPRPAGLVQGGPVQRALLPRRRRDVLGRPRGRRDTIARASGRSRSSSASTTPSTTRWTSTSTPRSRSSRSGPTWPGASSATSSRRSPSTTRRSFPCTPRGGRPSARWPERSRTTSAGPPTIRSSSSTTTTCRTSTAGRT